MPYSDKGGNVTIFDTVDVYPPASMLLMATQYGLSGDNPVNVYV